MKLRNYEEVKPKAFIIVSQLILFVFAVVESRISASICIQSQVLRSRLKSCHMWQHANYENENADRSGNIQSRNRWRALDSIWRNFVNGIWLVAQPGPDWIATGRGKLWQCQSDNSWVMRERWTKQVVNQAKGVESFLSPLSVLKGVLKSIPNLINTPVCRRTAEWSNPSILRNVVTWCPRTNSLEQLLLSQETCWSP